jgi:hypothetical protein
MILIQLIERDNALVLRLVCAPAGAQRATWLIVPAERAVRSDAVLLSGKGTLCSNLVVPAKRRRPAVPLCQEGVGNMPGLALSLANRLCWTVAKACRISRMQGWHDRRLWRRVVGCIRLRLRPCAPACSLCRAPAAPCMGRGAQVLQRGVWNAADTLPARCLQATKCFRICSVLQHANISTQPYLCLVS